MHPDYGGTVVPFVENAGTGHDKQSAHARHQMDSRKRRRLRRRAGAARLGGRSARLIAIDERRRAAIRRPRPAQARRNVASKEIGAAKKSGEEETAQKLMAEVAQLKAEIPRAGGGGEGGVRRAGQGARRNPQPAARRGARRQGRDTPMSSTTTSAPSATTPSRRSSISSWAKRSARWISRPPRNCRARVSSCSRAGSRAWNARSGNSCSTCIRADHGYTEVAPPLLVRDEVMFGTAQLPKFRDDQFLA